MESLYTKLRRQHTLKCKSGVKSLLEEAEITSIARYMPVTPEELEKILQSADKRLAHAEWILEATRAHWRDQNQFNDCVSEIMAFVNGGTSAINILKNVFRRIITHYEMDGDTSSVLDACGLYWQPFEGALKRKRPCYDDQPPSKKGAFEQGCT